MTFTPSLKSISDDKLLERLAELLRQSRRVEADLVAHIAEVDQRRLYAREACPFGEDVMNRYRDGVSEAEAVYSEGGAADDHAQLRSDGVPRERIPRGVPTRYAWTP